MTLRSLVLPFGASLLTSRTLRNTRRQIFGLIPSRANTLNVFLAPDDPYSRLLVQVLPQLASQHGLTTNPHWVIDLPAGAVPEPERLAAWALQDARWLADQQGLSLSGAPPDKQAARQWANFLAQSKPSPDELPRIFETIWAGELPSQPCASTARKHDEAALVKLGHYWPGMVEFAGEWYWGLDRLEHLHARLESRQVAPRPPLHAPTTNERRAVSGLGELELFWSARSPYSYLILDRVIDLAQRWQIPLRLRPVLPMVMRNLPVPKDKRIYIVLDTKREADRLHLDFGHLCDPLGSATERCYSVLTALAPDEQLQFASSFARGVWAQGIDAVTDRGMAKIAKRAGINLQTAFDAIADDAAKHGAWRDVSEQNRQDLLAAGGWGVPVMRWHGQVAWGQDRVEMIEQAMQSAASRLS